jgi:hypothetical protein
MKLIKLDLLSCLNRVIDSNGNCYQQKPYVAFPY